MTASPTHVTLAAATVATVTLDGVWPWVRVKNLIASAAQPVYFTVGSTLNPPADPTVAGNGTFACGADISDEEMANVPEQSAPTVVKLISGGTPTISVRGFDRYSVTAN